MRSRPLHVRRADRAGSVAGRSHEAAERADPEQVVVIVLGRELRAIETADAAGARHPRFKPSDDATALLMRLS